MNTLIYGIFSWKGLSREWNRDSLKTLDELDKEEALRDMKESILPEYRDNQLNKTHE